MSSPLSRLFNEKHPLGPAVTPPLNPLGNDPEVAGALYHTDNYLAHRLHTKPTILVGRRGSGKTAFLYYLSIQPEYAVVHVVDVGDAISNVTAAVAKASEAADLVESVEKVWKVLVWTSYASRVYDRFKKEHGSNPHLITLRTFLEANGLAADFTFSNIVNAIFSALKKRQDEYGSLAQGLGRLLEEKVSLDRVIDACEQLMKAVKAKGLILIDSLERYPLQDADLAKVMDGFLSFVGRFSRAVHHTEICCCIPSELFGTFKTISSNPEKDFENKMILHWNARELIDLAAFRMKNYFLHNEHLAEGQRIAIRGMAEEPARIWDHVVAAHLTNSTGGEENSVAYILRHTQLLPRHVISILNAVFKDNYKRNKTLFPIDPAAVRDGVRKAVETICQGVLSSYRQLHPDAHTICQKLLPNLPHVFRSGDFHRLYNRHKAALPFDYRHALRVLVEVGAVGCVREETPRYVKGEFEYTLPGELYHAHGDLLCVHPVFAAPFHVSLALAERMAGKPVYPMGADPEEDYRSALE